MGEKQNNIIGIALLLPPTPDGYQIIKPFEIPTDATTAEVFLKEIETHNNNETIIDVFD